jgi:lysophospholipase L1-like esterase
MPQGGFWLTGGSDTGRAAVYPDIILLMSGTNDPEATESTVSGVPPKDYMATTYPALVNKLVSMRPDAILLCAKISPFEPDKNDKVPPKNAIITNTVQQLRDAGHTNVHLVDMYTGFPSNGLSGDGPHPSDPGYEWMAHQWYNAIVAIETPEPNVAVLLITGSLAAAIYAWRKRRN